jgi:hypothetical protein
MNLKFFKAITAGFRKVVKWAGIALYCITACYTSLLTGCVGMMPTRVPPMTSELKYKVPNIKGWTTVGMNEAAYNWEAEKLNFWKISMDFVNKPMIALHEQAVDWLNIGLSAGLFGGAPAAVALALKKAPKGSVKKEEVDKLVKEAGEMDPDEFKKAHTT